MATGMHRRTTVPDSGWSHTVTKELAEAGRLASEGTNPTHNLISNF